jgi:hypothetical protein
MNETIVRARSPFLRFSVSLLIICISTGCERPPKSSLSTFISKHAAREESGGGIEEIGKISSDVIQGAESDTFSYYLVGLDVHYPFTSYFYMRVDDETTLGSGKFDPPLGQTCSYSDPKQCASEHKWRQVALMPCNIEIQLILFAQDSTGKTNDVRGDKFRQDCSAAHYHWNYFSN